MRDPCEKYHDHVANIYDDMYASPYWTFYHACSWEHMKPHLPKDLSVEVHDLGCGTGYYGLKLLRAGYRVCFSDLSARMLDRARRKVEAAGYADRAVFLKMDLLDQSVVADGRFGLVCAQGDPLGLCRDPRRGMREIARTLGPGGVAVLSVDNRVASYEHFLEKGDLEGLRAFHRTGVITWLAERKEERFPVKTFFPGELERLAAAAGLERISIVGKIVLPLRRHPRLLEDPRAFRALLRIERRLAADPPNLGRAAHLQAVFRKGEPAAGGHVRGGGSSQG